ncbi:MAG: arsenic resistance N-acetyltransferase ArsN2 [Pseudomonadota bacterium]
METHRPALSEARALLNAAGLPTRDLSETLLAHFVARRVNGEVVAIGGLEPFGEFGLLRSVVTRPDSQGQGLAAAIVMDLEHAAAVAGIRELYLLTETAADWFRRRGYDDAARESAPDAIRASRQFSTLCPDSAALLHKTLQRSASTTGSR